MEAMETTNSEALKWKVLKAGAKAYRDGYTLADNPWAHGHAGLHRMFPEQKPESCDYCELANLWAGAFKQAEIMAAGVQA